MRPAPLSATPITIADAQLDMRTAYYGGAPGVLCSGLVWLAAGMVALQLSAAQAVWTLLVGGMFIHPAAVMLNKVLGRSGKHNPSNPFGSLAMASTFWMIMCLLLAYGVSMIRIEWFFPAVLLIIGGRYMTFATVYGMRVYWVMGAALALAAYPLFVYGASPATGALAGGGIEVAFAVAIFLMSGRTARDAAGAARI
ncbi:DUF7010 family protein [Massilia sp. GCM10020059]|uniref:Uncharacterized protein n=1 Tax=Massilia agrisoli TaxID=2892444 RepID=A0ABS8IVG7_9BURK|nr:hypothetical protein [Massilia agrisoli]MCC6072143.1 hypothetical protein [Massilia agrisoli]